MTDKLKARLIAGLMVLGAFALSVAVAFATQETVRKNPPADQTVYHTFYSATTTSATSTANAFPEERVLAVAGAKKVAFEFSRGGATGPNTGSSKFEVEGTLDGTNWFDVPRLLLNDGSNTASSTIWITAATSTVRAAVDLTYMPFLQLRCQVVEVTDGEHTCKAFAEF